MYEIQLINHALICERRLEIETDRQSNRRLRFFKDDELDFCPTKNFITSIMVKIICHFIIKKPSCSYAQECCYKSLEG